MKIFFPVSPAPPDGVTRYLLTFFGFLLTQSARCLHRMEMRVLSLSLSLSLSLLSVLRRVLNEITAQFCSRACKFAFCSLFRICIVKGLGFIKKFLLDRYRVGFEFVGGSDLKGILLRNFNLLKVNKYWKPSAIKNLLQSD